MSSESAVCNCDKPSDPPDIPHREWCATQVGKVPISMEDALRAALDDLWACIDADEIKHLQPETVAIAKANHEGLWHYDVPWWMIWRQRQPS